MANRIFISGIECYGFHGLTEAEQELGNRFQIDVSLEVDISAPAASDRITDAVDYRQIHAVVIEWIEKRRFKLLEAMAEGLAVEILNRFAIESVTLRLKKLAPRLPGIVADVGVEVTLRKGDSDPGPGTRH